MLVIGHRNAPANGARFPISAKVLILSYAVLSAEKEEKSCKILFAAAAAFEDSPGSLLLLLLLLSLSWTTSRWLLS